MSLDFSVEKIADHENVTTAPYEFAGRAQWHPVTNALIWGSMSCGYNRITEDNLTHVWERINLWQHVLRGLVNYQWKTVWLTKEDIRRHIGLSTNASVKSDAEFMATVANHLSGDGARECAMELVGWKGHIGTLDRQAAEEEAV